MPKIFIHGVPHEVAEGQHLLQAVLSLGFDLPYFCWHPALHSVGACRQCAVKQFKDEHDTKGRIVMACMTPAADGTRISIDDEEARAFRANIIEWLMTNHPHDCPVCDEGGECHLQDMTLMSGHNYRRYRFPKRTFTNQYLGPFINHEMNRCITCYRCVRYYRDYAGGKDLSAFAIRNEVYFGRQEDGVLENEFSGNLIEVCPTGVFTDKTFKQHFTRKWDLQTAPSVCHHCSLGCNTVPGERYGVLRRIRNRYHHEINGYFLCDRGRFGYDFVNSDKRIRRAQMRNAGSSDARVLSHEEALDHLKLLIQSASHIVAIGSPRASLESNFALKQLAGQRGTFSNGMTRIENALTSQVRSVLQAGPAHAASILDIESSDMVVVLGEDLTNTAPRMALAVRQAARAGVIKRAAKLGIPEWNDAAIRQLGQDEKGPLVVAAVAETKLDEIAKGVFYGAPDEIARLGFALAHAVQADAPQAAGLSEDASRLTQEIAEALSRAERPVVIAGVSQKSAAIIEAAANLARALSRAGKHASIAFALSECNSMGASFLEGAPLEELRGRADRSGSDLLIVCENDLHRHMKALDAEEFLSSFSHVVVCDHTETQTTKKAGLVLPSAAFAEASGTLINNEGRAQRFFSVFLPGDDIQESWRWCSSALSALDAERKRPWNTLDEIIAALAREVPELAAIKESAPDARFTVEGLRIPRETPGFSGRTAMLAHKSVHEQKPPIDVDSPLSFSMEGYQGQPPPSLTPFVWAPGWNSVQASTKYQSEAGGALRGGDPGVRVIAPKKNGGGAYASAVPPNFVPRDNALFTVFLYHLFGSEETSVLAPAVRERVPAPYFALNPEDAAAHGLKEGAMLTLVIDGVESSLPVRIMHELPKGVVGLPWGLPAGRLRLETPAWVELKHG